MTEGLELSPAEARLYSQDPINQQQSGWRSNFLVGSFEGTIGNIARQSSEMLLRILGDVEEMRWADVFTVWPTSITDPALSLGDG